MNEIENEIFNQAEISVLKGIYYKLLAEGDFRGAAAIAKSLFDITGEDGEEWKLFGLPGAKARRRETPLEGRNRRQRTGGKESAADKDYAALLQTIGDDFLAQGDPESAIPYLKEAVKLDPDFALAQYDLSLAYVKLGLYREGSQAARAALRDDPEMKLQKSNLGLGATENLGLCYLNQDKFKKALECFNKNIALVGSTYFNIGLTLFRMERYEEAFDSFSKALEITPNDPEYLNLLGQTYGELGKLKEAEDYLKRALEIDPNYAIGYYDLGLTLAQQRTRDKEAKALFVKAIKLDPDMAWAYYSIACIDALLGKREAALKYFEIALEKDLDNKKHIDEDTDLDSIRKDARFVKLMKQYFGGKKGAKNK
jgi:tetratricopeptide (TPR) repeat protein